MINYRNLPVIYRNITVMLPALRTLPLVQSVLG